MQLILLLTVNKAQPRQIKTCFNLVELAKRENIGYNTVNTIFLQNADLIIVLVQNLKQIGIEQNWYVNILAYKKFNYKNALKSLCQLS